jgi:HEAT repeat protein
MSDATGGGRRLSHAVLAELSNLAAARLDEFMRSWPALDVAERRRVVQALNDMAEEDVELEFNDVFLRLTTDADPEVRVGALEGLWEDERAGTADLFVRLLREDPDERVRAAAADALGRFALHAALGDLSDRLVTRVRDALADVLATEPAGLVRRRAVGASGYLLGLEGDSPFREAVRDAYASPEVETRASAIRAMGRAADPAFLETVLAELRSEEPELRYEAARAAGEIADERAASPVIQLLADADTEVRLAAIQALGAIGGNAARQALLRLRQRGDATVVEAVDAALDDLDVSSDPVGVRVREINPN